MLLRADDSSFFHTSSWARVLHESYNYKPLYFASIENGIFTALVPMMEIKSFLTGKRGVSLPFTDSCPLIINEKKHFPKIIDRIINYGKNAGWKYIEWRDGGRSFKNKVSSCFYYGHVLDLAHNEKETLSNFRSSTRRNIKKAIREGVDVGIFNSLESVKDFCRLNCMTRKDHGLPPQPHGFFMKLYEYIISKKKGFVVLASYAKRIIAAAVYLHFGDQAIYKYGASNRDYQHLRPNNLVMWQAIKWCVENGFRSLSFGRTEPENTGLLQFKRGWGAGEKVTDYYKYDLKNSAFVKDRSKARTSYSFFRKMPSPLLNLAGTLLYRHVG